MDFEFFSQSFWSLEYFGNTLEEWTTAGLVFVAAFFAFWLLQYLILVRLKQLARKTKNDIDDTAIKIVSKIRPPFYFFLAFVIAVNFLELREIVKRAIDVVLIVWATYLVVTSLHVLVDWVGQRYLAKEKEEETRGAVELLRKIAKGILWAVAVLFLLSNLGVNITSLVAGLGIGGIAVAFALQNILDDLFSSFAIYFDKPFKVGDFIVVGDHMGVVQKIGIKTTRITALQGEEIVISNKELTNARVQNFKKMSERRVVFSFGVTYQTSTAKIKEIPSIVRGAIGSAKDVKFDRVHFNKFDDSALTFEAVYYVKGGDYNKYMDTNQEILVMVKEKFEKKNIEMAYPTQTIHLFKEK